MLFQFRRLCFKNVDALLLNTWRHYSKPATGARRKFRKITKIESRRNENQPPIIICKKNMYNFYEGDTYMSRPNECASHGWKNRASTGDYFCIYPYNPVGIDANEDTDDKTFRDYDINPAICDTLEKLDITKPLEVQKLGIPTIFKGSNVLLAAETGCGKTLAYLLPIITRLLQWKPLVKRDMNSPLGLIVTPSRELAVQIALEVMKLCRPVRIRTKLVTGGRTKKLMLNPPVGNVDILICSFGVISKLSTFGIYNLDYVRCVVLDEADALFHDTFEEKLRIFMKRLSIGQHQNVLLNQFPDMAQLILSSATFPSRITNVLHGIVDPNSLQKVTTERLHRILVPQKFIRLIPSQKPTELLKLVKQKVSNKKRIIIFSNHNTTSHWVYMFLKEFDIKVTNLNGNMPLNVRRGKYGEFINGETMVLSTTNGGSRGLDTIMVNHILNYDFPLNTADYIHRCGRTGRVGTIGESRVTSFISRRSEAAVVEKIEIAARKMKPIPIFDIIEGTKVDQNELKKNDIVEESIEDLDRIENVPF